MTDITETDIIRTDTDLVKGNFEFALAWSSDDELINANTNVAMVLSMIKDEQLRRIRIVWQAHNDAMMEEYADSLEAYELLQKTYLDPQEGQLIEDSDKTIWEHLCGARVYGTPALFNSLLRFKVFDINSDNLKQEASSPLELTMAPWKENPHENKERCSSIDQVRCNNDDCFGSRQMFKHIRHYPSEQEMPGAPVYPAFDVYHCFACGDQIHVNGGRKHMVGGVDFMGQPLHANLTTDEVVELYARTHPDEFSPDELERYLPREEDW